MGDETIYTIGGPEDRADIIDFLNYVYSQAHSPHDFKRMFPRIYGDHLADLPAKHFLAKQNGRIRALVYNRTEQWHVLRDMLNVGIIGSVAVHPYSRGEGFMKRLMADAMEDARERACDLMILNGKRQRYNYFGFERAGWINQYSFTRYSVRHALSGVDSSNVRFSSLTEESPKAVDLACAFHQAQPVYVARPREEFLDTVHILAGDCRLILMDGKTVGYIVGHGSEIVLEQERCLPAVIKALFEHDGIDSTTIPVPAWQTERMAILAPICDKRTIEPSMMIHVFRWQKVIEALLQLKASFMSLQNGTLTLSVDGETMTACVADGKVKVIASDQKPDLVYDHLEAERALFGLEAFNTGGPFLNWFPLPLCFFLPDIV